LLLYTNHLSDHTWTMETVYTTHTQRRTSAS